MKKIFNLCLLLVLSTTAYCQSNLEEVVYLKNGSSLRGTIIEQIPNQTLKVQTKDGSIFVCNFSDVEKITKEKLFISPYYNKNANLAEDMKRHKKNGIGLTVTAGVLIVVGSSCFAIRDNYYDSYYGYSSSTLSAGGAISGITLLCASAPFLIAGPIELAKYGRLKRESLKGLSFAPCIKTRNLDGISTNPLSSVTTFGASIKFTF